MGVQKAPHYSRRNIRPLKSTSVSSTLKLFGEESWLVTELPLERIEETAAVLWRLGPIL